jgi:methionyl aminopeptidase
MVADKNPPVHSEEDIAKSRESCRIARTACDLGHAAVKPGVTTEAIDKIVHDYIIS